MPPPEKGFSYYFETSLSSINLVVQTYLLGFEHISSYHRFTSILNRYSFTYENTREEESKRRECVKV
jgi:outer membrane phospholipase A